MARVIAFDVNETLLDLAALDGPFTRLFGTAALRPQWFTLTLQLSFTGGLTGEYVDFSTAQHTAALMLAEREGIASRSRAEDAEAAAELVAAMRTLPPHPEADAALRTLAATPLHLVALTNSPQEVAEAQLAHAGLAGHFDRIMSAGAVRQLKPARAPYVSVAEAFGVSTGEVRLVAAHSWDVTGALRAGCEAAFVARPGMVMSPLGPQPGITGPDLAAVAARIVEADT